MKNCDLQISPLWLFKRVRVRMHDFKKLLLSLSSELYHSERLHVKEIKLGVKTGNEAVAQLLAIPHCRMRYIMQKKPIFIYPTQKCSTRKAGSSGREAISRV